MVRPAHRTRRAGGPHGQRLIVYGDHADRVDATAAAQMLAELIDRAAALPPGLARHAALITALVEAGRIAQGLADIGAMGIEALLMALANAVVASWDSGFARTTPLPAVPMLGSVMLDLRLPEGYAFYGVFPEAYIEAARAIATSGNVRVIGIRSIGTSLGAIVAATLGAPAPTTVRPGGHPFDRRVDLDSEPLGPEGTSYIVVDEGPGLSGSSFVAVVDALERRGVDRAAIILMPGHDHGPGGQAGEHQRRVWATTRCVAATGDVAADMLSRGLAAMFGVLDVPLRDLSGGGWRSSRYADEAAWPAVDPSRERRKFLAVANGERWLARFVGLGGDAEAKLARARQLYAGGFVPEPRGLIHGFLVERWVEASEPRDPPIDTIAAYLGARARLFTTNEGASLVDLLAMARANVAEALGYDVAQRLDDWVPCLDGLIATSIPVAIDGRCQRHEWLDCGGGRLLKADAHDHARSHDLIGAQDIAWDVAATTIEFDLDPAARRRLIERTGTAAGRVISPGLVAFLTPCYLAFRLGDHAITADALSNRPAEAARNRRRSADYAERIDALLTTASEKGDDGDRGSLVRHRPTLVDGDDRPIDDAA